MDPISVSEVAPDTRSLVERLRAWKKPVAMDGASVIGVKAVWVWSLIEDAAEAATALEAAQQENARLEGKARTHQSHSKNYRERWDKAQAELRASGEREERLRRNEKVLREGLVAIRDEAARSAHPAGDGTHQCSHCDLMLSFWSMAQTPLNMTMRQAALSEGPNRDPRAAKEEQP